MILHKDVATLAIGEITDCVNSPLFAQKAQATEFIRGFKVGALKQDLRGLLEFIAPAVRVSSLGDRTFSYRVANSANDLPVNNIGSLARGEGGEFGYVGNEEALATGKLISYGLSTVVENHDVSADAGYVQEQFDRLVNLIDGAKILNAIEQLDTIATPNAKEIALDKNPLQEIEEWLVEKSNVAGYAPNRLLIGRAFYVKLKNQMLGTNSAYGFSAPRTIEELGEMLGVEILCPKSHYRAGATMPLIAGDVAYAFTAESGVSREDLSNLKTFVGAEMEFYTADHPQGKLQILTASEDSVIKTTSSVGASKFTFASA